MTRQLERRRLLKTSVYLLVLRTTRKEVLIDAVEQGQDTSRSDDCAGSLASGLGVIVSHVTHEIENRVEGINIGGWVPVLVTPSCWSESLAIKKPQLASMNALSALPSPVLAIF